ncbi:helix-turn-helix transcriptional regulator [Nocardia tengchongensis]|uniref:helix-turn-helix transcriptional regulator n=1 Tax=Nocardia tengchongensis TaxID=2055889 RepID=UPI003692D921
MRVKDGGQIRRWRRQKRFSQRELAYLVRRTQNTIYLIESGKLRSISEDLAVAIASRLEVPWEDLFDVCDVQVMPSVAHGTRSMIHPRPEFWPRVATEGDDRQLRQELPVATASVTPALEEAGANG